ncbi:GNAT family N-acetyltransferase [Polymorphum gilvum]|uniref:Acetyltransferase, GNAT family n=1 Tax=Polymorphum gilvum (strain LMG 25793 / CGMCC 1.9160 / SL003B-26A1) TaxID=991905 RepID=F2J6T0_POLGS|nr:GNAT family protein [Polymorphum gilvum]ADZ72563.1 Acetyltransferase, GNAT family [Polymorphum gilvum SL003B-26A1]
MSLPVLTTRRLVLRPLQADDAEAVAALCGRDFAVARWLTSCSWPYEEGAAEAFVTAARAADPARDEAVFAVTLGGVLIGSVAVQAPGDLSEAPDCPTLGYWIGRPFQRAGYSAEAAQAALDWGFAMHACPAIAARAFEDNAASRAVLRRLGFRPAARTMRYAKALDRKVPTIVMRLGRADFEARRIAA